MIAPALNCESLGSHLGATAAQHLVDTFKAAFGDPGDRKIVHGQGFSRIETGADHLFGNFVYAIEPDDADATRVALEPFARLAAPSAALFPYDEVSEGVEARLAEAGLEFVGAMPAMAVDIEAIPSTALPDGYDFLEVGVDREEEWVEALSVGYEIPLEVSRLFSPRYTSPGGSIVCYAAEREGRFDAVSMCARLNGIAGIYCVATRPDARGIGLGAHVTAEPLRRAAALGYGVGALHASEMGYPVYERLGFTTVSSVRVYVRMPGA